jgi:hypothetical protein
MRQTSLNGQKRLRFMAFETRFYLNFEKMVIKVFKNVIEVL